MGNLLVDQWYCISLLRGTSRVRSTVAARWLWTCIVCVSSIYYYIRVKKKKKTLCQVESGANSWIGVWLKNDKDRKGGLRKGVCRQLDVKRREFDIRWVPYDLLLILAPWVMLFMDQFCIYRTFRRMGRDCSYVVQFFWAHLGSSLISLLPSNSRYSASPFWKTSDPIWHSSYF